MEKVVPIFYTCYGRYISRFRAIPFYADCLIPVQRRLLLSLHEIAKGPKTIKSAKIIGHVIGNYSPHGDLAAYGALVSLYKQGFIETQGNFGTPGLDDAEASSMRYTEACIKSWVEDFCFKYIDFVHWENFEYENEPLFLPCPIPIGLIGDGDIQLGISFHKCMMPRYKMSDLAKRLRWLILRNLNVDEEEPIIYPNFTRDGCTTQKDDLEAKNILTTGSGTLTVVPNGNLDGRTLHVLGRVPQTTFNKLRKDERISVNCMSGATIDIAIKPLKKVNDIQKFYSDIYQRYLIKNINFNIYVCDEEGKVFIRSIDELLITCYSYYVEIVKYKLINDCLKEIEKKFENEIILIIREIIKNNPTIKTVDEIIQILHTKTVSSRITTLIDEFDFENNIWKTVNKKITDDDVKDVCNKRNIKALIEQQININNNNTKINDIKNQIINNVDDCFKLICDIAAKV